MFVWRARGGVWCRSARSWDSGVPGSTGLGSDAKHQEGRGSHSTDMTDSTMYDDDDGSEENQGGSTDRGQGERGRSSRWIGARAAEK